MGYQSEDIKKAACFFCYQNCGMLVTVKDGNVQEIVGDPDHPINRGAVCARGLCWDEWLDHPARVNHPLKNTGRRGENHWVRVSWDQALDEIAQKLKEIQDRYGAEAVTATSGTNRTDDWARRRFFNIFGSPNLFKAARVCWVPHFMVEAALYGWASTSDISNSKCAILWGHNPAVSYLPEMRRILDRKEQGSFTLIVVDPRFTETASLADIWLQLVPGTDAALALGMLNVIVHEGLYDKEFLSLWSNAPYLVRRDNYKLLQESDIAARGGRSSFLVWDDKASRPRSPQRSASRQLTGTYQVRLRDSSVVSVSTAWELLCERVSTYTPEHVENITGIPKEKIFEAAKAYATQKPSCIQWGVAVDHIGVNAGTAIQSKALLRIMTGNLDLPGGDMLSGPQIDFVTDEELELNDMLPEQQKEKQLGGDMFRLLGWQGYDMISRSTKEVWGKPPPADWMCLAHPESVWKAILEEKPYPVKALIVTSDNPLVSYANSKLVYRALSSQNLELMVSVDLWLTPSAMLADYVLPAAGWLERPVITSTFGCSNWFIASERAIQPLYERRTDYEFWRELGIRLGQKKHWPWKDLESVYGDRLKHIGSVSYDDFVRKERLHFPPTQYAKFKKIGFATPSGKAEIYSSIFESLGYDPLPSHHETYKTTLQYPFILVAGGCYMPFHHSEGRQLPSQRAMTPDPICDMNPKTACKLGISEGEWVYIRTRKDRIRQKVRFNLGIHPQVVYVQKGWWFPEIIPDAPRLSDVFDSNANVLTNSDAEDCDRITGCWHMRGLPCNIEKIVSVK